MTLVLSAPTGPYVTWTGKYRVAWVVPRVALPGLHAIDLEDCSGRIEVLYRAPTGGGTTSRPPQKRDVVRVTVTRAQAAHGGWYNRVEALEPIETYSTLQLLPHRLCPEPGLLCRLYCVMRSEVERPALWRFLDRVFAEPRRARAFVRRAASRDCHHTEPGGLLRHSLELVEKLRLIIQDCDDLTRQCVLLGALLHDLGKVAPDVLGRTPYWPREHALMNKPLLERELCRLREEDLQAWQMLHFVFSVIDGSVDGSRVPEAKLIVELDRYSAGLDARRRAFEESPAWRQIGVLRPGAGGPARIFYRPAPEDARLGEG
ncbi:HD domain-containing protein [Halorhodospira halophila]|uniref:HD domain-containing protein n=1 Tax=Halorhodospira halophila TaxID=1053 RepID=UPI00191401DE|nr:hypothetical protein [Halorhodospira halophila]